MFVDHSITRSLDILSLTSHDYLPDTTYYLTHLLLNPPTTYLPPPSTLTYTHTYTQALYKTICYMEEHIMERHLHANLHGHQANERERDRATPLFVYLFVWDRFRMIAKDFILQISALPKDPLWVECHERMARWFVIMNHYMTTEDDFGAGHAQQVTPLPVTGYYMPPSLPSPHLLRSFDAHIRTRSSLTTCSRPSRDTTLAPPYDKPIPTALAIKVPLPSPPLPPSFLPYQGLSPSLFTRSPFPPFLLYKVVDNTIPS